MMSKICNITTAKRFLRARISPELVNFAKTDSALRETILLRDDDKNILNQELCVMKKHDFHNCDI